MDEDTGSTCGVFRLKRRPSDPLFGARPRLARPGQRWIEDRQVYQNRQVTAARPIVRVGVDACVCIATGALHTYKGDQLCRPKIPGSPTFQCSGNSCVTQKALASALQVDFPTPVPVRTRSTITFSRVTRQVGHEASPILLVIVLQSNPTAGRWASAASMHETSHPHVECKPLGRWRFFSNWI